MQSRVLIRIRLSLRFCTSADISMMINREALQLLRSLTPGNQRDYVKQCSVASNSKSVYIAPLINLEFDSQLSRPVAAAPTPMGTPLVVEQSRCFTTDLYLLKNNYSN